MSEIESLKERLELSECETDEQLAYYWHQEATEARSKLAEAERALEQISMFAAAQEIMDEPEEFGGTDDGAETLCMVYENIQFIAERALVNIRSDASIPAKQGE